MSHRERPKQVLDAILNADYATLSILGYLGGKASGRARRARKARFAKEIFEIQIQTNEYILGLDGEDGSYPDGIIPEL